MSLSKTPKRRNRLPLCDNLIENPDAEKFEVNGPFLVCRETWLVAYESEAAFKAEQEKNFPGFNVEKKWRCVYCGRWHATGSFPINTNKSKGAKGKA